MRQFDYRLFADYFQFYLQDESADGNLGESWTDEAVARMLATAPGAIGVGTVRNVEVPVALELLDAQPTDDHGAWDHVTECSLQVPTGRIVIAGCSDDVDRAHRIEVEAGTYRVRVSYGALTSVSSDGLAGDDHYRVQLWKAPSIEARTVKQRKSQVSSNTSRPSVDAEVVNVTYERSCSARLSNEIMVVFAEPAGETIRLGDVLRFVDLGLDMDVEVINLTQDRRFSVRVAADNVHDLRLPIRHGGSRTPTRERLHG